MARRAEPVRTCVGCRSRAAAANLLRVVAEESSLVPDPRRRLPGRGAHLHPDQRCLELAERRQAFRRALRVPGPLDVAGVREFLRRADRQQGLIPSKPKAGRDGDESSMSSSR